MTTPLLLPAHAAWAIQKESLPRILDAQRAHHATLADLSIEMPPVAVARRLTSSSQRVAGAVAVLPLTGVITPRGSFLSMLFGGGGGGLCHFREQFGEALVDPDVGAIVLDIDSPGGLVSLVPETADEIRAARGVKPIIAVCNTLAASAAYWIASACDEVVCTPSGEAGSVGVYMVHDDYSAMNEKLGVDVTYVKAGKYKAEGNPDEPLGKDGEEAWQEEVNDIYDTFLADVAEGRGASPAAVASGYGEGRCLLAPRAKEAGLIDRIDTIETVIGELLGQEPDAEDDAQNREARRVTILTPDRLAESAQPKCQRCGKFLSPGESTCADCALGAEDDKPDVTAEGEPETPAEDAPAAIDDLDDEDDEEDETDDDGKLVVDDEDAKNALLATLQFG